MPAITNPWCLTRLSDERNKDDWKNTFSFVDAISVGCGGSSSVFLIDKKRVIKVFPQDAEGQKDLERETAIYLRIRSCGQSEYIVKFYETWESGLVLERYDKTLRQTLMTLREGRPTRLARQWTREFCRGLDKLHQYGIWHGDLGCQNTMVDQEKHLKICDFAGSKFRDGDTWKDAWVSYEVRSQHPGSRGKQPTVETEIFALGSVLFEIWTSIPPYASETDSVVQKKFIDKDFPLTMIDDANIREIIRQCWMGEFSTVAEICTAVE